MTKVTKIKGINVMLDAVSRVTTLVLIDIIGEKI